MKMFGKLQLNLISKYLQGSALKAIFKIAKKMEYLEHGKLIMIKHSLLS
jgi:hypothetical protein